jgi:uncharacterized membrane protein YphA (DoxX/SURF4 family)
MRLHVAEVLLALVFLLGGLGTWRNPQPRAAQLEKFGLPLPTVLVRLNAAVMLVAGAALALNIEAGLASQTLTEKGWTKTDANPDALVLLHGA